MKSLSIALIFYSLFTINVNAYDGFLDEDSEKVETSKIAPYAKIVGGVLIFEVLISINAIMASEYPSEYGGLLVLMAPLIAVDNDFGTASKWVTFAELEFLGIYNINITASKTTKNEIFINNMIAWHVWVASTATVEYFTGGFDKKTEIGLMPYSDDGLKLVINHKF